MKLKAVGIHIFAGLFTRGVIDAGFDPVMVLEDGQFGVDTHRFNFPNTPVVVGRDLWPVAQLRSEAIDLVYSNSPCAGFSVANASRGSENEINSCLDYSSKIARAIRPKVYMVESVASLFTEGDAMVRKWEHAWRSIGYKTCRLLESSELLGLPQIRKRAVFVAAQANIDFMHPPAWQLPATTVRNAIYDLVNEPLGFGPAPYKHMSTSVYELSMRGNSTLLSWHIPGEVSAAIRAIVPHLKPGKRADSLSEEVLDSTYRIARLKPIKAKGRPSLLFRRLDWDKPSVVLTGAAHWFHPEHDRLLTIREQARLMGVPDNFGFGSQSKTRPYAELGKAVSPVVGRWLAQHAVQFCRKPEQRVHHNELDLSRAAIAKASK